MFDTKLECEEFIKNERHIKDGCIRMMDGYIKALNEDVLYNLPHNKNSKKALLEYYESVRERYL